MVFTTNTLLERWSRVLPGPDLAEAVLGRIFERGRIVTLEGPSMRTRHLDSMPDPTTAPFWGNGMLKALQVYAVLAFQCSAEHRGHT